MAKKKEEPKNQGVKLAIRQAGEGTITKPELKGILDSAKSSGQFVQKLDQINKNLKQNDKAAIGLNAAASNMLIRQASKQSPTGYDAYMSNLMGPAMGTGRLGTELQRRATEFGTDRNMSSLIPGGQYMMPSGRTANVGFGKQYTYSGGGLGTGPYNSTNMPMNTGSNDVGPLAPGTAKTDVTTPVDKQVETPMTPEEMQDASTISGTGMLSGGGAGAAGANKLGRAKSRLRQLGINGRGTGLLTRGLQYGNTLNTGR
jgi:hypothetical protein